eukprot:CAMPEP_0174377440 /NCGR_PEP_ID=MMETSP0811_2-20130205/121463_1 /TAXON_ID=73025 ORGANISM="Eutreptiella gymnastica-like, Strain CCMP1594" /NCGR_SAMPLE_ID=MMETSP0811_2 /ASSEMBLY_ACC=CAM_ASM_000667 /LENGTH=61 /DNA_ID=CAMNT_0015529479 /DNA_START=1247 /DNA_END=1429 /DNA_ORIENTATION=-
MTGASRPPVTQAWRVVAASSASLDTMGCVHRCRMGTELGAHDSVVHGLVRGQGGHGLGPRI